MEELFTQDKNSPLDLQFCPHLEQYSSLDSRTLFQNKIPEKKYERFGEVMSEMKVRFFTFFGCEKVIEKFSIYSSRHDIKLEIIHGPFNLPNR